MLSRWRFNLWTFLLVILLSYECWGGNKLSVTANEELIFANIIFRHGERNIIYSYPTDPWREETNPNLWEGGYGTITKVGKQQLLELGKFFRRRYEHLLKQGTHPLDLVYVQSSNISRTKESAKSFIDGFFPPTVNQTYNNGLKWQQIPINVIPKALDSIIRNTRRCAKYRRELQKFVASIEYQTLLDTCEELFYELEEATGLMIETFSEVFHLYDTLNTEKLRNLTLPDWTNNFFYSGSDLEQVAHFAYQQKTHTVPLARLRSGFLIRDMLDHFTDKIESKLNQSVWIYSGHDATVFSLLNTLDVLVDLGMHIPTYAATVLFELYKSTDGYYVQLFYKKTTADDLHSIEIPNCGIKCPLKTFLEVYKNVIPTADFDKECRVPDNSNA